MLSEDVADLSLGEEGKPLQLPTVEKPLPPRGGIENRLRVIQNLAINSGVRVEPDYERDQVFWYRVTGEYQTQRQRIIGTFGDAIDTNEGEMKAIIRKLAITNAVDRTLVQIQLEKLEEQALTDGLTGAYNRRWLDNHLLSLLRHEGSDSVDHGRPPFVNVVVLMDIDLFKNFNDRNGHTMGDIALQQLVVLVKENVRAIDSVARYGGEEFCLVMPAVRDGSEDSIEAILRRIELLRQSIAINLKGRVESVIGGELEESITSSFGAHIVDKPVDVKTVDDLRKVYDVADGYLYEAKKAGRNVMVTSTGVYKTS